MTDLSVAQPARRFGLRERIPPGAPAAHCGLRAFPKLEPWNCPQDFPGLRRYLLPMAKMAGLMVGDRDRLGARRGRRRPAKADLAQPLRDVADLGRPNGGASGIDRIAGKEGGVALQVGAAPRRVREDRVVFFRVDRIV